LFTIKNHHLDIMYIFLLLGIVKKLIGDNSPYRHRRMWLDAHIWVGTVRIYSDAVMALEVDCVLEFCATPSHKLLAPS
jgi:hypothetical protein